MDVLKLVKKTLDFDELKQMLGPEVSSHCRFLIYDQLRAFKSMEDLFKGQYDSAIILLQEEDSRNPNPVGHFILLLNYPDKVEHFDSYGLDVDEELHVTKEKHLSTFFNQDKKAMDQNHKQLQKYGGNINTCGRWCVGRLLLKHLNLNQFIHLIQSIGTTNDQMITLMTMILPYKV